MLEVAVIGAGASGLTASRHLVGHGLRPSIFEATKCIGGAWSTGNPKMWSGLTTNLSKYTCRFSEWPWAEDTPLFPSAVDMGRYLEGYSQNFLDPTYFQYHCQVTSIEAANSKGYRVEWMDLTTSTKHSKDFEGVIVASGFFSKPHFPGDLDNTETIDRQHILHSSEYASSAEFENQTVAVVGSSFSAMEIAVDVSSAAKRVIHVVPRVPWVLPRHVPFHDRSDEKVKSMPAILPVDLALYRRTQEAPQIPELVEMSPEMAKSRHEYLHSIVGRRQENSPLGIPENWEEPPMVAISDYYLDLVVQGNIEVLRGRFRGKPNDDDLLSSWEVESPTGQSIPLRNIDTVICATGYESSLDNFLHPEIIKTLAYDSSNRFSPMISCWDTLHPDLPNLFFCGMYRGPYMGIMEQQGRLAARILSGSLQLDCSTTDEALENSRKMRCQPIQPQFPHFDYLGLLDTLNGIQKNSYPTTNLQKGDMVVPAFYQTDDDMSKKESLELQRQVDLGRDGSRIPGVVLSSIIGEWNFDRRIIHFGDNRQEHVYGAVKFTRPALQYVLYREDGLYELSPSKTLSVFREYEYQVAGDCLEIYFVEQGQRAHLFLSLKFSKQEGDHWVATSDHLCIKDLYMARFEVELDGLAAANIKMTYRVKGPTKDYESTTVLSPNPINKVIGMR